LDVLLHCRQLPGPRTHVIGAEAADFERHSAVGSGERTHLVEQRRSLVLAQVDE